MKTFIAVCVFFLGLSLAGITEQARAQALPTASAVAAFQAGAGYTIISPDYGQKRIQGFTGFADYDFSGKLGVEFDAHIGNLITPTDIAENSYLAGPRYVFRFGRLHPYVKGLVGVGQFRVLETQDNQGIYTGNYITYGLGGGLDYLATQHIVIRAADFEYQKWPSFGRDGLSPLVYTFGVAYRFH